jgi:hypothetical protein
MNFGRSVTTFFAIVGVLFIASQVDFQKVLAPPDVSNSARQLKEPVVSEPGLIRRFVFWIIASVKRFWKWLY